MLLRVLAVLLANAVPLAGVLARGWSAGTVLALFWCETILWAIANSVRIVVHRRQTRLAGHWLGGVRRRAASSVAESLRSGGTYLGQYALMVFPFTLAHGFFLFTLLAVLGSNHVGGPEVAWLPRGKDLWQGVAWIAGIAAAELLVDLVTLSERSFTWLKAKVESSYGRVLTLHLGIVLGMVGIAMTSRPLTLLLVVIAIKTLVELWFAVYGRDSLPERMPRWYAALVRKAGKDPETEWQQTLENEKRNREASDAPLAEPAS